MVRNPSFPEPNLHSTDEMFSNGLSVGCEGRRFLHRCGSSDDSSTRHRFLKISSSNPNLIKMTMNEGLKRKTAKRMSATRNDSGGVLSVWFCTARRSGSSLFSFSRLSSPSSDMWFERF